MKPAKRYASPASAVPDILIIRALENRFGNLVPYQHRYCLLWCVHVATLSGFLKLPTLALLISDDRFIEHVNCDPDMNVCRALLGDYSNAHAYTRCFFSYHQNMSEFDLPLKH